MIKSQFSDGVLVSDWPHRRRIGVRGPSNRAHSLGRPGPRSITGRQYVKTISNWALVLCPPAYADWLWCWARIPQEPEGIPLWTPEGSSETVTYPNTA